MPSEVGGIELYGFTSRKVAMLLLCRKSLDDARPGVAVAEDAFGAVGGFECCAHCVRYPFGVGGADEDTFACEVAGVHEGDDLLHGCSS